MIHTGLAVESCLACGTTIIPHSGAADGICHLCKNAMAGAPGPYLFHREDLDVLVAREYCSELRALIAAFKKRGNSRVAQFIAEHLLLPLCRHQMFASDPPVMIAPVPAHHRNRRQRGFDQVSILAAILHHHTGWPVVPVIRRSRGRVQKSLHRAERIANAARVMLPVHEMIAGISEETHIIILDDVMTTGATLESCGAALRSSGVRRISALAVAAAL